MTMFKLASAIVAAMIVTSPALSDTGQVALEAPTTETPEALVVQWRGNLENAYRSYMDVKFCHESRDGYVIGYINDVEMIKSRAAIKAVEAAIKGYVPSLDTEKVWESVTSWHTPPHLINTERHPRAMDINRKRCQAKLSELMVSFKAWAPEARKVQKDF